MATQLSSFVQGKIGNLVMYQLGGKYVVRSRPATVHKTQAMRTCSTNFGIASKTGKQLRLGLASILPNATCTHMQRRFSGCINKWLGRQLPAHLQPTEDIAGLSTFSFSENTSFQERFKPRLTINILPDGRATILIPAFVPAVQIAAPAHTTSVELRLAMAACTLNAPGPAATNIYQNSISFTSEPVPATTVVLDMEPLQQKLVLVVASLRYFLANGKLETRDVFMPASVVKAAYF